MQPECEWVLISEYFYFWSFWKNSSKSQEITFCDQYNSYYHLNNYVSYFQFKSLRAKFQDDTLCFDRKKDILFLCSPLRPSYYFIEAGRDTPTRHQQTGHYVQNFVILSKKYQAFLLSNSSNILLQITIPKYFNQTLFCTIFYQKMTLIGKFSHNSFIQND